MALFRPVRLVPNRNRPGTYISGRISQPFDGRYSGGRGYIRGDLPVKRGNRRWLYKSVQRDPIHLALDFACPVGTPVYAVHDGVIVDQGKYWYTDEWYVALRIKVTAMYQFVAFYTHLRHDSMRFKKGDRVKRGQIIAKSGMSGWTDGPHLHFELRRGFRWQAVDFSTQYNYWLRLDPVPFFDGRKTLAEMA